MYISLLSIICINTHFYIMQTPIFLGGVVLFLFRSVSPYTFTLLVYEHCFTVHKQFAVAPAPRFRSERVWYRRQSLIFSRQPA